MDEIYTLLFNQLINANGIIELKHLRSSFNWKIFNLGWHVLRHYCMTYFLLIISIKLLGCMGEAGNAVRIYKSMVWESRRTCSAFKVLL